MVLSCVLTFSKDKRPEPSTVPQSHTYTVTPSPPLSGREVRAYSTPWKTMASPSSGAAIPPASSISAAASAAVVTSSTATAAHGFRAPSNVMASIPRFFAKMASLGYVGTAADPTSIADSPVPAVAEAFTTLANATASAAASQVSGNVTAGDLPSSSGAFGGGMRSLGSLFAYMTSKWAVLCLFMVALLSRSGVFCFCFLFRGLSRI